MTSVEQVVPRRDLLLIEPLNLAGFVGVGEFKLYAEQSDKLPPIRAIVVKVGRDVREIQPGDEIMYHRYAEEEVRLWDPHRQAEVEFAFLSAQDVMTLVQGRTAL